MVEPTPAVLDLFILSQWGEGGCKIDKSVAKRDGAFDGDHVAGVGEIEAAGVWHSLGKLADIVAVEEDAVLETGDDEDGDVDFFIGGVPVGGRSALQEHQGAIIRFAGRVAGVFEEVGAALGLPLGVHEEGAQEILHEVEAADLGGADDGVVNPVEARSRFSQGVDEDERVGMAGAAG